MNYPVMEHFLTLQGEGAHTGKSAYFIRLGGCDVGCVWCDVKESWDAEAHPIIPVEQLITDVQKQPADIVVITGGEPSMYDLDALTSGIIDLGKKCHIETAATNELKGRFDWVCISPKKFKAPLPSELKKANELKVIVYNPSDFDFAESFTPQVPEDCKLFLQPEWSKQEKMLPAIVEYVKHHPKWSVSLQTHKILGIP